MNIFFDLDGTLIDSKQRLYQLFQQLAPQSKFTFDEYWSLKHNKINHQIILEKYFKLTVNDINSFEKKWMESIESEEFLKFDKPFDGVTDYLLNLKKNGISRYLITSRQFKKGIFKQLGDFGWTNLFDEILVTAQCTAKEDLIKPFIIVGEDNWIVGDTGKDIQVGKYLGINTVAVLTGFLSKEVLLSYHPDLILEKVIDFNPLITKITK